jgi:hypothetical protein
MMKNIDLGQGNIFTPYCKKPKQTKKTTKTTVVFNWLILFTFGFSHFSGEGSHGFS